jgi:hypothetical protein
MRVRLTNGNAIAEVGRPATRHNLTVPTIARRGTEMALTLTLPRSQPILLQVYDPAGRLELSIDHGMVSAGRHELGFTPAATGVHLAVLTLGGDRIVHKLSVVD